MFFTAWVSRKIWAVSPATTRWVVSYKTPHFRPDEAQPRELRHVALERRSVEVCAGWVAGPNRMGLLHATPARGKEVFSFELDREWLGSANTHALDPALRLGPGPQFLAAGRDNFGLFLDSSPDRWGRVLMQRREALLAREGARKERRLTELDYLLGVYDGHRMGGLRFRTDGGPFLDDDAELVEVTARLLEDDGRFEVRIAANGFDAGMMVKEYRPDLIVLDVMLPDINGKEVCQRVRADSSLEDVRIVCISGMIEEDKIQELKLSGADDFLHKPFMVEELIDRMCAQLDIERASASA